MREIENPIPDKAKFYAEHNKQWQQSGISQEKYCKSVNISYFAFLHWRQKFLSKDKKESIASQKFLPVKPILPEPSLPDSLSKTQCHEIRVTFPNDVKLSFPVSINPTIIANCIKMMREVYDNTEFGC